MTLPCIRAPPSPLPPSRHPAIPYPPPTPSPTFVRSVTAWPTGSSSSQRLRPLIDELFRRVPGLESVACVRHSLGCLGLPPLLLEAEEETLMFRFFHMLSRGPFRVSVPFTFPTPRSRGQRTRMPYDVDRCPPYGVAFCSPCPPGRPPSSRHSARASRPSAPWGNAKHAPSNSRVHPCRRSTSSTARVSNRLGQAQCRDQAGPVS
ncbi:hypothetical protein B0T11DRAFT_142083 [Plectosphaerella cucumerina]|uniref:Uncharacterized protein n=1 Tax=Plectosphaerella cucumerina TaxID=40658 RepID=A0A8K0TA72_9PEZI|nr:hypothetical protein B0T11DRAFT_142083 [Plectosphaerella cucumerina]